MSGDPFADGADQASSKLTPLIFKVGACVTCAGVVAALISEIGLYPLHPCAFLTLYLNLYVSPLAIPIVRVWVFTALSEATPISSVNVVPDPLFHSSPYDKIAAPPVEVPVISGIVTVTFVVSVNVESLTGAVVGEIGTT